MSQLKNISQNNPHGNFIISSLKKFEREMHSETPSIKMVLSGEEQYSVNGRNYSLAANQYLLVDDNEWIKTSIDSKKNVKGICIFPEKELLNEVANYKMASLQFMIDNPFEKKAIRLVHNLFHFGENRTGKFLTQHVSSILQLHENKEAINFDDFYLTLSECIIEDQLILKDQLQQLASVKKATKEELYRRASMAKNYLTDNYTEKISLDDLAAQVFLSKYHLIRTFKDLFQLSPYQYLLQLRLQKAKELIAQNYSYRAISNMIGFSDERNLRKALLKYSPNKN